MIDTLLISSRAQNDTSRQEEPRVLVQSEDEPERMLLETRICKEDGFQKQQGTFLPSHLFLARLTLFSRYSNSMDGAL